MSSLPPSDSRTLTHADYFARALRILTESSHEELTISALCDALQVSKGSFYHHFGGWPGFVKAFLENWELETTLKTKQLAEMVHEPKQRHRILKNLIHQLPNDAEGSIRVWARTDSLVRTVQVRVDEERISLLSDAFSATLPANDARQLAELHHLVLIGLQLLERPVSSARVRKFIKLLGELERAKYGAAAYGA